MTLKVAFQMDPMESIDITGDSSFALALEAQERGHKLFHYEPKNLSLSQLKPVAKLRPLTVQNITGNHFSLGEQRKTIVFKKNTIPIEGTIYHEKLAP